MKHTDCVPSPKELRDAALAYRDRKAHTMADICVNIAKQLENYGYYSSGRQHVYAANLVRKSKPLDKL
jgi:hypothetical protein